MTIYVHGKILRKVLPPLYHAWVTSRYYQGLTAATVQGVSFNHIFFLLTFKHSGEKSGKTSVKCHQNRKGKFALFCVKRHTYKENMFYLLKHNFEIFHEFTSVSFLTVSDS